VAATTGGQLTAHEADASLLVDQVLPVVGDVTGRTWHGLRPGGGPDWSTRLLAAATNVARVKPINNPWRERVLVDTVTL